LRISGTLDEPVEFRANAVQTAERYADELGILTGAEAAVSGVEDGRVTVSVSGGYVDLVPFFPATVTETVSVEVELFEPDTGELS
jgi:CubicO group peptidase (beta-lactamase class C family)